MQPATPTSAAVADGSPGPHPDLGSRGRLIRILCAAAAVALLLYGNIVGNDRDFPFGPFKMYALYFPPNAVISSTEVMARTAAGRTVVVTQADTGVSHADFEAELDSYEANPDRLGGLAAVFHQRFPNAPRYVEVWVLQTRWQLHNRGVAGRSVVRLVDWHAA